MDARLKAAEALKDWGRNEYEVVYGTSVEAFAGVGAKHSLKISGAKGPEGAWSEIQAFMKANENCPAVFQIGFDIHYAEDRTIGTIFIPDRVEQFKSESGADHKDSANHVSEYVGSSEVSHVETVKRALDWIGGDKSRRLTVARREILDYRGDLLDSVQFGPRFDEEALTRSCYFRSPDLAFLSQSPELLAMGKGPTFSTYKLSGTAGLDSRDEEMLSDIKLAEEHDLSAAAMLASLSKLGHCRRLPAVVYRCGALKHIMSEFKTDIGLSSSFIDCVEAVFPVGANPVSSGLDMLVKLEKSNRGPYYGVYGIIEPDMSYSVSQNIRSIFLRDGVYEVWVGGCVTWRSDPVDEWNETELKLASCPKLI